MLNALLLEVECKKKAPKGPDPTGPTPPKQASPVELTRAIVALLGRRQDYKVAVEKHRDLITKLAKAKAKEKAKVDHDLACAKLSLAASENWVKFGVQRWKLLADFADAHGAPSGKLTNVLNYGNAQAKLAGAHIDAVAKKIDHPAIDDLVLKGNKLFKNGQPYSFSDTAEPVKAEPVDAEPDEPDLTMPDVPVKEPEAQPDLGPHPSDADWAAYDEPAEDPEIAAKAAASHADAKKTAAEPEPEPEPAPVVPAKPTPIETLTYEQRAAVRLQGKELVTAALKATGEYPSSSSTFETLVPLVFGPEYAQVGTLSPDAAGQILNELDSVRADTKLHDTDMIEAGKIADKVVAEAVSSGAEKPEYAKLVSQAVSKQTGKWVPYSILTDVTKNAVDKVGVSYSSLTATEKEKGNAAVAEQLLATAWNEGFWPPSAVPVTDVQKLFSDAANVQISKEAAHYVRQWTLEALDLFDTLDEVPAEKLDELVAATAKNIKDGMLLSDAGHKAVGQIGMGLSVLSPDAQAHLHAKVIAADKKPVDELGFLAAVKKALELPVHAQVMSWTEAAYAQIEAGAGKSLAALAASFGIPHVDPIHEKIVEVAKQVKIKKFDAPGFKTACIDFWNDRAKTQTPTWDSFGAWITIYSSSGPDLGVKFSLSDAAAQAAGSSGMEDYLHSLFNEWLTDWNAKQAALTAPPPVVTAPVPTAAPTPIAAPKPALPPGYDYYYSKKHYKKLSKPDHLSDGMFIYLANKCIAAIEGGALLTAKGEVGPKKVASAVNAIHASFKNDWATAGITQIGKDLVAEFMKNALDTQNQNLSMVGSPNYYSKLLDKYGKSYIAVNAKLGMSASLVAAQPKVNEPAGGTLQDVPALLTAIKAQCPNALTDWENDNVLDIWNKTVGAGKTPSKGQSDALKLFLTKAKGLLPAAPGMAPISTSGCAVPAASTLTTPGAALTPLVLDPDPGATAVVKIQYDNIPALFAGMKKMYPLELTVWDENDLALVWNMAYGAQADAYADQVTAADYDKMNAFLEKAATNLSHSGATTWNPSNAFLAGVKKKISFYGFNPKSGTPAAPAVNHFTTKNIPALLALMKANFPGDLDSWEKSSLLDWATKANDGESVGSSFESYFQEFLDKAKARYADWTPTGFVGVPAASASAPAPAPQVGVTLEISPTAPASTYQALGVGPRDNPLGMTYEEIAAFASLDKPASSPEMPAGTEEWKPKGEFFGGSTSGGSKKWTIGLDVDGAVSPLTFSSSPKAHGAWMFKPESSSFRAFGEVASNRVQMLLGFVGTPDAWTKTFKGEFGSVQKFDRADSNFRENGTESTPWTEGESAVEELQKYFVLNYITGEHDDHGGNFAIMPDGRLKGLDRAQAFKFFDSSHSALDYYNLGDTIPFPHYAVQNDSKGMPSKTLKHWANGGSISLMPLTFPSFEAVIARAEAIPSDLYKAMWKPYAEKAAVEKYPSHHTGNPALGEASKVPADKTVEGFLEGANNRRKNIRASIGAMYAALAKTRAQSLKTKGDARPLAEIESEIRDQLGLDAFLQGAKPAKEVSPVSEADPAPPTTSDEAWDNPNLPATSKMPTSEKIADRGVDFTDMVVGGSDLKDGRVQFYQLGENPFSLAWLDRDARARLEARLPGAGMASGPTQPVKPAYPVLSVPDLPTYEIKNTADLWRDVMAAGGVSTSQTHPATTQTVVAGQPITKAEKYLDKWAKGEDIGSNTSKVWQSVAKAGEMAASSDPLMRAAGLHYVNEFKRISTGNGYAFTLKPSSSFTEEERKIKPFVPSGSDLQAQADAKAAAAAALSAANAAALAKWEADKKKIDDKFVEDMAKYATSKAEFDALAAAGNKLPAKKFKTMMVPGGAVREAAALKNEDHGYPTTYRHENDPGPKKNLVSRKATWDGTFIPNLDAGGPIAHTSFEIDFSDTVLGQSGLPAKKRLIAHYLPAEMQGSYSKAPGRTGEFRIMYPEGSTSAQVQEYTRRIYATIGVDAHPASAEEHELNYLRKMAWLRKIEGGWSKGNITIGSEPVGPVSAKIQFWIDLFKKEPTKEHGWTEPGGGVGYDPRYVPIMQGTKPKKNAAGEVLYTPGPDGKPLKNPYYQPMATRDDGDSSSFRRFDITDEVMQDYIDQGLLLSKVSSDFGAFAETWLNQGSLQSTERSENLGFRPKGKSTKDDSESGGSNWAYLFVTKPSPSGANTPSNATWQAFDPRLFLRTNVWSALHDTFGSTVHGKPDVSSSQNRAASVQEGALIEMIEHGGSSAEVLVSDQVSYLNWLTYYRAPNEATAKKWIKKLKDAGTTHMGPSKVPVERIITHLEYADWLSTVEPVGKKIKSDLPPVVSTVQKPGSNA